MSNEYQSKNPSSVKNIPKDDYPFVVYQTSNLFVFFESFPKKDSFVVSCRIIKKEDSDKNYDENNPRENVLKSSRKTIPFDSDITVFQAWKALFRHMTVNKTKKLKAFFPKEVKRRPVADKDYVMRHAEYAMEIAEMAKTKVHYSEMDNFKNSLGELIEDIKYRCVSDREFLLTMGYAALYADTKNSNNAITKLFGACDIINRSKTAVLVAESAERCNHANVKKAVSDMINGRSKFNDIVRDVMASVHYADGPHEKALILTMIEAVTAPKKEKNNHSELSM